MVVVVVIREEVKRGEQGVQLLGRARPGPSGSKVRTLVWGWDAPPDESFRKLVTRSSPSIPATSKYSYGL